MYSLILADNAQIEVRVYPKQRIIHHVMKGFCRGANLRDGFTKGTAGMKAHGATKWLSDDRANSALTEEDGKWATAVWFPATLAAGWKHWAVVMPEKAVGKLNIARFVQQYLALGINAQPFSESDKAMKWLDQQ